MSSRFSGTSKKTKNSGAAASSGGNPTTTAASTTTTSNEELKEQQTNVRVIRFRFGGKRWEVPVLFSAYKIWREEEGDADPTQYDNDDSASSSDDSDSGSNKKKPASKQKKDRKGNNNNNKSNAATSVKPIAKAHLLKILISDRIFGNAYKRETARDVDVKKTFPGQSFDEVASLVLRRGELVEIQQDRTQEHKHVAAAVQDAIAHAFVMVYNKFSGELFERDGEFNLAVKPFLPVMRNLLAASPAASSSSSAVRIEPIWRVASWLARQLVLDDLTSSIADEARIAPIAKIPLVCELTVDDEEEKTEAIEQKKAVAFAKLKAIVETDWSGMVKLLPLVEVDDNNDINKNNESKLQGEEKVPNDDDNHQEQTQQKQKKILLLRASCLVFGHHINISDRSHLNLNWFEAIAQSIFAQTSWKLQSGDVQFLDVEKHADLATSFLKEIFDLPSTISFPHYTSLTSPTPSTTEVVTTIDVTNNNEKKTSDNDKKQENVNSNNKLSKKSNRKDNNNRPDDTTDENGGSNEKSEVAPAIVVHDKYEAMTHRDLQALCKKKGFSTGGKKADMLSRIRSCDDDDE